ncbi:MAG TPA: pyridoxamine 5'-phosphate oxidase family protein [Puia sp.]|nr:pyridoxamine 5'-phosphate oxidase family protein [Puia sp.]
MTREFLYEALRSHRLGVLASLSETGRPEAALVGIAVTSGLEIVFDTVTSSRKYANIRADSRVALVIGWKHEISIQYEGDARELSAAVADDVYREAYYAVFPEGRERTAGWAGLTHFVVRPTWIRYSNFNPPAMVEEMRF